MGCSCTSLYKFILITINVVFLLSGALMLALGIALVAAPTQLLSFVSSVGLDYSTFANATGSFFSDIIKACGIFMIILGSVVALVAFFGFFGTCCDNKCLLITYTIILFFIVVAEIALIIFAACYPQVFKNTGSRAIQKALLAGFQSDLQQINGSFVNGTDAVDVAWMAIQLKLQCCGGVNASDYNTFEWIRLNCTGSSGCPLASGPDTYVVPVSCCKLRDPSMPSFPTNLNAFVDVNSCLLMPGSNMTNNGGCFDAMTDDATDFIKRYSNIAIGIAAGIVGVEIILIVLAICVCCRADKG